MTEGRGGGKWGGRCVYVLMSVQECVCGGKGEGREVCEGKKGKDGFCRKEWRCRKDKRVATI